MSYLFDPDNWEWLTTGNNVRFILEGFLINLEIALVSMVFALIFGLALALLRLSRVKPVSVVAGAWIDVFRNLPLIFLILYFALGLPGSWKQAWEDAMPSLGARGVPVRARARRAAGARPLQLGRAGRDHARRHPLAARAARARRPSALGMTYRQSLRHVILPAGPAADGPGDRVAADHPQQGHDAGLDHRDHRGHAPRAGSSPPRTSSPSSRRRSCTSSSSSGFLFVIVNYALSRLSRRLELRERKLTGTKMKRVARPRGPGRHRARVAFCGHDPRRLHPPRADRRRSPGQPGDDPARAVLGLGRHRRAARARDLGLRLRARARGGGGRGRAVLARLVGRVRGARRRRLLRARGRRAALQQRRGGRRVAAWSRSTARRTSGIASG